MEEMPAFRHAHLCAGLRKWHVLKGAKKDTNVCDSTNHTICYCPQLFLLLSVLAWDDPAHNFRRDVFNHPSHPYLTGGQSNVKHPSWRDPPGTSKLAFTPPPPLEKKSNNLEPKPLLGGHLGEGEGTRRGNRWLWPQLSVPRAAP